MLDEAWQSAGTFLYLIWDDTAVDTHARKYDPVCSHMCNIGTRAEMMYVLKAFGPAMFQQSSRESKTTGRETQAVRLKEQVVNRPII